MQTYETNSKPKTCAAHCASIRARAARFLTLVRLAPMPTSFASRNMSSASRRLLLLSYLYRGLQADGTRGVQVVVQLPGDVLDHLSGLDAVSGLVERGGEDGDGALAGDDRDDAAAHPALRRDADVPRPAAGAVVQAGHHHGREDVRDVLGLDDLLAGRGVLAVVRERGPHARQLQHVDADRALPGVDIHGLERVRIDAVVLRQQHRERLVACVGRRLRLVDFVNQLELLARGAAVEVENLVPL